MRLYTDFYRPLERSQLTSERRRLQEDPYFQRLSLFSKLSAMNNLSQSYGMSAEDAIREQYQSMGVIGGVETKNGLITGLPDSSTHALFNEHRFAFPTPDGKPLFSDAFLKQIMRELARGIFDEGTYPFFSLHFNTDAVMYPVLHPAYQDTLVGKVISYLDYDMKGFINGGIYPEAFLETWHQQGKTNRQDLKPHLIDLKAYCATHLPDMPYESMRESMAKAGLEGPDHNDMSSDPMSAYRTKFRTSFRIIAHVDSVQEKNGVFLIKPDFEVLYTIDLMPDYKEQLDAYKQQHGHYPAEYQKIEGLYQEMAVRIKEQMPQLPLFKPYFNMLGVIAFFSSYYKTLKTMNQIPVLEPADREQMMISPKAFPPIPVRYYQFHRVELSLKTLIDHFQSMVPVAAPNTTPPEKPCPNRLDHALRHMYRTSTWAFDASTQREIEVAVSQIVKQQFPADMAGVEPDHQLLKEPIDRLTGRLIAFVLDYARNPDFIERRVKAVEKELSLPGLLTRFKQQVGQIEDKNAVVLREIATYEAAQLLKTEPAIAVEDKAIIDEQAKQGIAAIKAMTIQARANKMAQLTELSHQVSSMSSQAKANAETRIENTFKNQLGLMNVQPHQYASYYSSYTNLEKFVNEVRADAAEACAYYQAQYNSLSANIHKEINALPANEQAGLAHIETTRLANIRRVFHLTPIFTGLLIPSIYPWQNLNIP